MELEELGEDGQSLVGGARGDGGRERRPERGHPEQEVYQGHAAAEALGAGAQEERDTAGLALQWCACGGAGGRSSGMGRRGGWWWWSCNRGLASRVGVVDVDEGGAAGLAGAHGCCLVSLRAAAGQGDRLQSCLPVLE